MSTTLCKLCSALSDRNICGSFKEIVSCDTNITNMCFKKAKAKTDLPSAVGDRLLLAQNSSFDFLSCFDLFLVQFSNNS